MKDTTDPLQKLSLILAKNYFDSSCPGARRKRRGAGARIGLRHVFQQESAARLDGGRPERTVLILGSGASAAAFGRELFPLTGDALPRLDRRLGLTPDALPQFDRRTGPTADALGLIREQIDERVRRIKEAYGYHDAANDFETRLAVLSDFFSEQRIEEELARMYGERYHPHLAFEIIAHMFRHRFLDVIINFNFDELLDQAIQGELGTSDYHHVLSDGDCKSLDRILVDDRLKIPVYIKPHGTASSGSSMRFTKDAYFQLPKPMRRLLEQLLGGHYLEKADRRDGYKPYHVNVITVGFGMKSVDLLSILRSVGAHHGCRMTLFHIGIESGFAALEKLSVQEEWERLSIGQEFIATDPAGDGKGDLARVFDELWNAIRGHFVEPFRPRGIARHRIVHELFYAPAPERGWGERRPAPLEKSEKNRHLSYFRARLLTELALALARGNGQIDLQAVAGGRIGTYFDLMRACPGGSDLSVHTLLQHFTDGEVELTGPDESIFRIPHEDWATPHEANARLTGGLWTRLRAALEGLGDIEFRDHLRRLTAAPGGEDRLRGYLAQLASSDSQDVTPKFKDSHLLLSREPDPDGVLHTTLSLTMRFVEMLRSDWDLMLCVSETGKVMEKVMAHVEAGLVRDPAALGRRFCLVVADNDHPQVAAGRLREYRELLVSPGEGESYCSIPAWAHNQHMVILLRREEGGWRTTSAIRYEKVGIGNRVNPVYLDGSAKDLRSALSCFIRYVHMAEFGVPPATSLRNTVSRDRKGNPVPTPQEHWEAFLATL